MRFSLWPSSALSWPEVLDVASQAEATGWDGIWLADHFMPNADDVSDPMHECFSLLAALAASVPRVRLGSLVAGNTYRHPAVLAKAAATIDHVSGGRFVLGLGAGWQENEHAAYGIDLGTVGERIRWFAEACEVITSLRDHERTTFDGQRYQLAGAPLEPKPIGPLPLLIGASGEKAMPPIVARHADEWNVWGTPERFAAKSAVMTAACEAIDRDPASLQRSTQALMFIGPDGAATAARIGGDRVIGGTSEQLVEIVAEYAAAGLDELIVPTFTFR
ncbi:MAG TPA: TIGR03560 family F420-dependent LLM class oxidoreductase, partial [Acidimicrobiales bacterium]